MREIRVPHRLWWGFWVSVAGCLFGASAQAFLLAVNTLPHDHTSNTLAATLSFYTAAGLAVCIYYAGWAFLFPPPREGETHE